MRSTAVYTVQKICKLEDIAIEIIQKGTKWDQIKQSNMHAGRRDEREEGNIRRNKLTQGRSKRTPRRIDIKRAPWWCSG